MNWTATRDRSSPDGSLWRVAAGDRTAQVTVAPGPELLPRLERAVAAALGLPLPPPPNPPRFTLTSELHEHGGPFELERDTLWTVFDSGRPLRYFKGGTSHDFVDGSWSDATGAHGCDEVALGADGLHVLVRDSDEVVCHPLPGE